MRVALLNIQRMGARGVMRGGWRLVRAPSPTSGKTVTETVTPLTYALPSPPGSVLSAARGSPQPTARLGSALPGSLGTRECTCSPIKTEHPFIPRLGGERRGSAQLPSAPEVKEVSPPRHHRTETCNSKAQVPQSCLRVQRLALRPSCAALPLDPVRLVQMGDVQPETYNTRRKEVSLGVVCAALPTPSLFSLGVLPPISPWGSSRGWV